MLNARGWKVAFPERTFATVDHIVPTRERQRPFLDVMAEQMMSALERNCAEHGIPLYNIGDAHQGIVHVIGPELGLTQPGMTIACGDSHTSTHGAFGSVAFGIGTSQVRDVLASQCLALEPLQVRRIDVTGRLAPGRVRQGRHSRDHPAARRKGRRGIRLRVRRPGGRPHVDGRADDDLQHVDRRRRPRRLREPRRDDLRVSRGSCLHAARRGLRGGQGVLAKAGVRCQRALRRPRRHRRRCAGADGDLGHQPRTVRGDQRRAARPARGRSCRARRHRGGAAVHGLHAPASRSRARVSTSRSSDRARTADFRTFAKRRASCAATGSPRM